MTWKLVTEILILAWGSIAAFAVFLGIAAVFIAWLDRKIDG